MARKKLGARVVGPTPVGGKWRVIAYRADGTNEAHSYGSEKTAANVAANLREALALEGVSIEDAERRYIAHVKDVQRRKPRTVENKELMLGTFFPRGPALMPQEVPGRPPVPVPDYPGVSMRVSLLNEKILADLYTVVTARIAKAKEEPISVAYHRAALAAAKTFLRFCAKKGWCKLLKLDDVTGTGTRNKGKNQPRIDDARLWFAKAIEMADQGDDGAVAALMAMTMGLRSLEISSRIVNDLDNNGKILRITFGKTNASVRDVPINSTVRPYLLARAQGRPRDALFFPSDKSHSGRHDKDWVRKSGVHAICRLLKMPLISAHGLRGFYATRRKEAGDDPDLITRDMGHTSTKQTMGGAYAERDAGAAHQQQVVLSLLQGGKTVEPAGQPKPEAATVSAAPLEVVPSAPLAPLAPPAPDLAAVKRFWAKVQREGEGCWLWTGPVNERGYGQAYWEGRTDKVTRIAWQIDRGDIPDDQIVAHAHAACDRRCVRPDHLQLGTMKSARRGGGGRGARHGSAKMTEAAVVQLWAMHRAGRSAVEIGAELGVSEGAVRMVLRGDTWREASERIRAAVQQ
jgi:integrase